MKGHIKRFFAGANTAKGFIHFYDSILKGLDRIYILKGGPGTGKSSIMKDIGLKMKDTGLNVEFIHCSSDPDSLDGVIIPQKSVAIVDGTSPHIIEPKAPGCIEEYINLGIAWDSNKLRTRKNDIKKLNANISDCFKNTYSLFSNALSIHDDWEKIYIKELNFNIINELSNIYTQEIFPYENTDNNPKEVHKFFGSATPKGTIDFIPNLTESLKKRYFIKGRPGTGKSTFLKKLKENSLKFGYDVEVYHCGFDPNSLDMLIFPSLDIAIFDSTAPHEYFPSKESDEVIDIYEMAVSPNTDEKYATELEAIKSQYKEITSKGIESLYMAKTYHDELEKIYVESMDFQIIDRIKENLLKEINNL